MANYNTLQEAIDSGINNMTVLRNNSNNDDGTTTYASGIDWFKFNNVVVSNIYSSGNSWLGLGTSSEQLKVNRRDCAVWWEYKETGTIGVTKFFKFRWIGFSAYSSTSNSAKQGFDVFLLENGQIFLNYFIVPSDNRNGSNQLVCGSQTLDFTVSSNTPCEFTFIPSDSSAGTGWSLDSDRPDIDANFKPSGSAVFSFSYTPQGRDTLLYGSEIPEGTSLAVYTKVNNGSWRRTESGSVIRGMSTGTQCTLSIKVEMSTSSVHATPKVYNLRVKNENDMKILILTLNTPNVGSAIGDISIDYDGNGGFRGDGGPMRAFTGSFTPSGLTWKGHHAEYEHLSMSTSVVGVLTAVTYSYTKEDEHLELGISANGTLTYAGDL